MKILALETATDPGSIALWLDGRVVARDCPRELSNSASLLPVAEAVLRHEQAKSDDATPQEKKQAAVEQAHALSTRPQGSYAQLHEVGTQDGTGRDGDNAVLAVPDEGHAKELKAQQAKDEEADRKAVAAASPKPSK